MIGRSKIVNKKNNYFFTSLNAIIIAVFIDNRLAAQVIDLEAYQEINSRLLKFVYHFLFDISLHLGKIGISGALVVIGVWWMLNAVNKLPDTQLSKLQKLFSIILSLLVLIGYSFTLPLESGQSSYLYLLVSDSAQLLKTVLTFYAWLLVYNTLQRLLNHLVNTKPWQSVTNNKQLENYPLVKIFRSHPFWVSFGILAILWLPALLIDYPGVLIYDGVTQIMQFNGYEPLRTDHPLISTIVLGYFVNFGRFLGSAKLGLFLYTLFQSMFLISAFSFVILTIHRFTKNLYMVGASIITFGCLPIVLSFTTLITKDIFFAGAFIFFNTLLVWYFFDEQRFNDQRGLIWLVLSGTIGILFRKNILYVFFLFFIISVIMYLFKNKTIKLSFLIALFLPLLLTKGIDGVLATIYDANTDGLRRESLSLPFQQTARYAKYHSDEVTAEEVEIIDKVIKYEGIGERYVPHLSNNVKFYHNEEATTSELIAYFKVWFKQFLNHPVTYFEATGEQNISLFTPFKKNVYFNHLTAGYRPGVPKRNEVYEDFNLSEKNVLTSLQKIKLKYYQIIDRLPLISLINTPSAYVILLLLLIPLGIKYHLSKYAYLSLPTLIMLLTLIAGPIVQGYTRYTALFVFLMPVLLLIFSLNITEQEKKKLN